MRIYSFRVQNVNQNVANDLNHCVTLSRLNLIYCISSSVYFFLFFIFLSGDEHFAKGAVMFDMP